MQRSAATMRRTVKGKGSSASGSASSVWYGPDRPLFLGPFSEAAVPSYLDGEPLIPPPPPLPPQPDLPTLPAACSITQFV